MTTAQRHPRRTAPSRLSGSGGLAALLALVVVLGGACSDDSSSVPAPNADAGLDGPAPEDAAEDTEPDSTERPDLAQDSDHDGAPDMAADTQSDVTEPWPLEESLWSRIGAHKVAAITVSFADAQEPLTPDQVRNRIFTRAQSANAWFREVSYDKFWLEGALREDGDVFAVTLPMDSTPCDYDRWGEAARELAATDGFDAGSYDFVFFVFEGECKSRGRPMWNPPSAWMDNVSVRAVTHEGGHAIGWAHASRFQCRADGEPVTLGGECTHVEYGDPFDVMGQTGSYHTNQHKRGQLGWLSATNTLTVTENGRYSVRPIEIATDEVLSLRVPRIVGPDGLEELVYIEARQPFGFDDFEATFPAATGATLRLAGPYDRQGRSYLLDTNPATEEPNDAPLQPGDTFTDPATGMSITLVSAGPDGAVVDIEIGTALLCQRQAPSLELEPATVTADPGTNVQLTMTVTNNDVNCPYAQYIGTYGLPADWDNREITGFESALQSGAQQVIDVQVPVPGNAGPGAYTFSATVAGEQGDLEATGTVTINVP